MRTALIILLLAACGDNRTTPDANDPGIRHPPPIEPETATQCADFDIYTSCPDAAVDSPVETPPELDEETKAACCHALLDGFPPNHECGYPPGLCKNGQKDLFCVGADGRDAKFTLCNP